MVGTAVLLAAAFYLPIFRAAARVPVSENEIARLEAENGRIRELVAALDSAEQRYSKIRQMLGADIVPDPGFSLDIAAGRAGRCAPGSPTGRFASRLEAACRATGHSTIRGM